MTIRKQVVEDIKKRLQKEITEIEYKISTNKYAMKKLVDEQTILKRTKIELYRLINHFYKGEGKI